MDCSSARFRDVVPLGSPCTPPENVNHDHYFIDPDVWVHRLIDIGWLPPLGVDPRSDPTMRARPRPDVNPEGPARPDPAEFCVISALKPYIDSGLLLFGRMPLPWFRHPVQHLRLRLQGSLSPSFSILWCLKGIILC